MDQKNFLKSVTFWGLIATMAGAALSKLGYTTDADSGEIEKFFVTYGPQFVEAAGIVIAAWGRVRVKTTVGLTDKPAVTEDK